MKGQLVATLALIGISIFMAAAGQTSIKLGVDRAGNLGESLQGPVAFLQLALKSPLVLAGFVMYAAGGLAWILVLSRVQLSFAYPFLALNFVLITAISRVLLSESIPSLRWFGIGIICLGILVVARSANS